MMHNYHPHVWAPEAGITDGPVLDDECRRCEQIAISPETQLDATRQAELRRRTEAGEWHQSIADLTAARRLAVPR